MFVHGGVHGNVGSNYVNVLRELLQQGYAVIAPDYRGSSGYGREFWELIDYGGLEIEDVFAGRQFMLENHDNIDPERVGIMGWSHGGLITLMNLFAHPKEFKVGYAGVPVSDLVARMGYHDQGYRDLFSAPYHIGKTVRGGRRRVPPPVAGLERREAADAAAHPHDDQRRGRERAGSRAPDQGAEGRRQDVRAQDLQGRAGRPPVQPPRHEVRQGIAGRGVPLPGEVPESAQSRQVNECNPLTRQSIINSSSTMAKRVTDPGGSPEKPKPARLDSIDLLRGVVMILMALDHVRDFFSDRLFLDPTDLNTTTPANLSDPLGHALLRTDVHLPGGNIGAFLSGTRGKSKLALSWFLFTRGLWLAFFEVRREPRSCGCSTTTCTTMAPASSGRSAGRWSCCRCSFFCRRRRDHSRRCDDRTAQPARRLDARRSAAPRLAVDDSAQSRRRHGR